VTINDLSLHAMSNSMGFGGVGTSGMGRYKGGLVGYQAFSNPKAVVTQGRILARSSENAVPPFKTDRQRNMILRLARLPRR
jgi:coniferyl-aldehyde dehydrogenase